MKTNNQPVRGRPRSDKSRLSILKAAIALSQELGFEEITIEGIAAKAAVGKQTIYRWWPNLASLLFEALSEVGENEVASLDNPDSLKMKPEDFIRKTFKVARTHQVALAKMMALAQLDEQTHEKLTQSFINTRREVARLILIKPGTRHDQQEFILDLFFGTLWYGILVRPEGLKNSSIDRVVKLLRGQSGVIGTTLDEG